MFIVSVFWAEADSVRAFSDNNRFGGKAGLSYSAEREFALSACVFYIDNKGDKNTDNADEDKKEETE